jgi:hypothetical protein
MAETLNDLIEGVQYAVIEAQEVAEEHHLNLISRFFEEKDGRTQAITQQVHVPNMNPDTMKESPYLEYSVPLICLMSLGAIKIDTLKVTFTARLSSLDTGEETAAKEEKAAKEEASADTATPDVLKPLGRRARAKKRRKLNMGMRKGAGREDDTQMTVEIIFKGTDPPEGVVRVNDRLLKTIP